MCQKSLVLLFSPSIRRVLRAWVCACVFWALVSRRVLERTEVEFEWCRRVRVGMASDVKLKVIFKNYPEVHLHYSTKEKDQDPR